MKKFIGIPLVAAALVGVLATGVVLSQPAQPEPTPLTASVEQVKPEVTKPAAVDKVVVKEVAEQAPAPTQTPIAEPTQPAPAPKTLEDVTDEEIFSKTFTPECIAQATRSWYYNGEFIIKMYKQSLTSGEYGIYINEKQQKACSYYGTKADLGLL
jgi:outer membrane biosynthesis protein TonB